MSELKSHVTCELSTLTNKTERMSLNLLKTVNAQEESVNKNVELLQQTISCLQKELISKNETIKSLLEVQSALIKSINKSTVNGFKMPRRTMEAQQNHPIPTFYLNNQHEHQDNHHHFGNIYKLI